MHPLTWPQPCRPPPHQPGFIKQTGPYIARAQAAQGRLIRRGGSSATLGPALGGGGGAAINLPQSTRPLLSPNSSP